LVNTPIAVNKIPTAIKIIVSRFALVEIENSIVIRVLYYFLIVVESAAAAIIT
jgi:hypothetical protein